MQSLAMVLTLLIWLFPVFLCAEEVRPDWLMRPHLADRLARRCKTLYALEVSKLLAESRDDTRNALLYRYIEITTGKSARQCESQPDAPATSMAIAAARCLSITYAADICHRALPKRWHGMYAADFSAKSGADLCHEIQQNGIAEAFYRVATVPEAKAFLQRGYAFLVGHQQAIDSQRDAWGFARVRDKSWHQTSSVIAYRGPRATREGFLLWTSRQPGWGKGPLWPADQPEASVWISGSEMQVLLDNGDAWAIAGLSDRNPRGMTLAEALDIGGNRLPKYDHELKRRFYARWNLAPRPAGGAL